MRFSELKQYSCCASLFADIKATLLVNSARETNDPEWVKVAHYAKLTLLVFSKNGTSLQPVDLSLYGISQSFAAPPFR